MNPANSPNTRNIVKFYIATGGNPDISTMGSAKKMAVYSLIWNDAFEKNSQKGARGELVNKRWISIFWDWAKSPPGVLDHIPPDVKDVMGRMLNSGKDALTSKFQAGISEIWNSTTLETKIGGAVVVGALLFVLIQLRTAKAFVGGMTTAAATAAIVAIIWAGLPKDATNSEIAVLNNGKKLTQNQVSQEIGKVTSQI